LNKVLKY